MGGWLSLCNMSDLPLFKEGVGGVLSLCNMSDLPLFKEGGAQSLQHVSFTFILKGGGGLLSLCLLLFVSCADDSVQKGSVVYPAGKLHLFLPIHSVVPAGKPFPLASLLGKRVARKQPACRVPLSGHRDLRHCAQFCRLALVAFHCQCYEPACLFVSGQGEAAKVTENNLVVDTVDGWSVDMADLLLVVSA